MDSTIVAQSAAVRNSRRYDSQSKVVWRLPEKYLSAEVTTTHLQLLANGGICHRVVLHLCTEALFFSRTCRRVQ
jgi:hypothetical protein